MLTTKLIFYECFTGEPYLTLPNLLSQFRKRYRKEFIGKEYSFLYNALVLKKYPISSHCVLMVNNLFSVNAGCSIELTDGYYYITTEVYQDKSRTNSGKIFKLAVTKEIYPRGKLHIVNAELIELSNYETPVTTHPYMMIKNKYRLILHYNGISRATPSSQMGLQGRNYFYKNMYDISPVGGPVAFIDVILIKHQKWRNPIGKTIRFYTKVIDSIEFLSHSDNVKGKLAIIRFTVIDQFFLERSLENGCRYVIRNLTPVSSINSDALLLMDHSKTTILKRCNRGDGRDYKKYAAPPYDHEDLHKTWSTK